MNNQTKKLKDFVTRNEAYIESSEWLTDQINTIIDHYELFQETGSLPKGYDTEESLYDKMLELDKRAAIEERIFNQLQVEQQQLLDEL